MKKYGGVNNQKSLNEIQEAYVISAPVMSKIVKKKSIASITFGWVVFLIVSYIFFDLLFFTITDGWNRIKMPFWAILIMPAIPFLIVLSLRVISYLFHKKRTGHKD